MKFARICLAAPGVLILALALAAPLSAQTKSVDEYIADLRSDSPSVQMEAARRLGQLGSEAAVGPLLELLETSKHERVAAAAAAALGAIGPEEGQTTQALASSAARSDWPVLQYASLLALSALEGDEAQAQAEERSAALSGASDPLLADLAEKLQPESADE